MQDDDKGARRSGCASTGPSPASAANIEIVDYPGILLANGLSDADELATLRRIEMWLSIVRRARGLADGHVGRLWSMILAGTRGGRTPQPLGRTGRTGADIAWSRLIELREAFDQLDMLAAFELVVEARRSAAC